MQKPAFQTLRVEAKGPRGSLLLDQPERLNPLGRVTLREIAEAARWLDTCPELKVVVVGGRGRAFSAGADLSTFVSPDSDPKETPHAAADAGRVMAAAVEGLSAVTIARIQGPCIGGGVVLASACDLRIAAADARLRIPEVDLGIPLGWGGIPRLVREIGPALTKEWVMTCRFISAEEARAAGFLNRVVPPEKLDAEVEALAAELCEKPRLALLATKQHANAITEQMVGTVRSWADADGIVAGLRDPEGQAAAARYLDRLRAKRSD